MISRIRKFDGRAFAERWLAATGHVDAAGKVDANESISFGRELEVVLAAPYDIDYLGTKARTLVPFNTEISNGAVSVTYKQFDFVGQADFITDYSSDFPSIEISGTESSTFFRSIGASYGYSVQDLREAQLAGRPLDAMKAKRAREAIERKIEIVACQGDALRNLSGLANQSAVTVITQGSTAGLSGVAWLPSGGGTATPPQIFADLAFAFKTIFDTTLTIVESDTVVFPTKIMSYLKSTLFRPGFSSETLLQVILAANPWIKHVDVWPYLDHMGADTKGRILVYKRDPKFLEFMLSQDFETFPPVMQGMLMTVNCHARIGGVQLRYPRSMIYLDGCGGTDA